MKKRTDYYNYQKSYDNKTKQLVSNMFAQDIERFNYEFEQ